MRGSGTVNNHFGWVRQRTAWQDIEYHRQKRAEFAAQDQANMDSINTAMSNALQNNISQSANLAGQAALKRLQDQAKQKSAAATQQIDDAQKLIDNVQAKTSSTSDATTSTSNMLDTVA